MQLTGLSFLVWMSFSGPTALLDRAPCLGTVQYSNCGRGYQTSALASEPRAHEGAHRPVAYPSLSVQVCIASRQLQ